MSESVPPPSVHDIAHAAGADPVVPHARGLFCNRTLNMRGIRAIGYDMDYTLVQYHVLEWERLAFDHARRRLAAQGFTVDGLEFRPEVVIRGLVIDTELGNLCKANRFGYVKRAVHGTQPMSFDDLRGTYGRTIVDLADRRWVFLNTLFSLSEACIYGQLVDRFDDGKLPGVLGYADLYERARRAVDASHAEGQLKAEVAARPEPHVELDPEAALTLLDQRAAGKQVLLVTNSEWSYTDAMMRYSFERYLPDGMRWRDLFDLVVVAAAKPSFFSARQPIYEVVSDDGLLRPVVGPLRRGGVYHGGHAGLVEAYLEASGDEILYVGDHVYGDVHVSKSLLRWRTALIVRELEEEIVATARSRPDLDVLPRLMAHKESLEREYNVLRLGIARRKAGYGPPPEGGESRVTEEMTRLRGAIQELDEELAPLAKRASEVGNPLWGPVMWAGNDKSQLARQVERSADVYTSRVSNFALATPYVYLRSPRGTLPHDAAPAPAPGGAKTWRAEAPR
jgi:HAD superfamily 5'-nucleotidase-like hydrolase